LLTHKDACRVIVRDDEVIRKAVSPEGRAVFLLLCTDAAIVRTDLADDDYVSCYRFLSDCLHFAKGQHVGVKVFEEHTLTREGDAGFLFKSDSEPARKDYWLFLTNVAGWFGALAAEIQQEYSHFADIDDADSINRIFFAWQGSSPSFLDLRYAGDALCFVAGRFPAATSFRPVDFGVAKVEFVEYLADRHG
jgi:hypothetical protein